MFVGYVDKNGYGYTFEGRRIGRKLCDERGAPVMRERECCRVYKNEVRG